MIVEMNDENLMDTAMELISNEKYFEALNLLTRVDSYESMLNQIGCFAMMDDVVYATMLYRKLLARYGLTHNCLADIEYMGSGAGMILSYYNNAAADLTTKRDPNKKSADTSKLAIFSWRKFMIDNFGTDEVSHLFDVIVENQDEFKRYDLVGTHSYEETLCYRVIKAIANDNFANATRDVEELLELDSDDPYTQEVQLIVCDNSDDYDLVVKYARRVADNPRSSLRGMVLAANVLKYSDGHPDITEKLMTRILNKNTNDLTNIDLCDLIRVAILELGYTKTTLELAELLYARYREAGCWALRLCIRVFYSCGEVELAREAAVQLKNAAPWDGVAAAYLCFMDRYHGKQFNNLMFLRPIEYGFDVATELAIGCSRELARLGARRVRKNDMLMIDCLVQGCNNCVVSDYPDEYYYSFSSPIRMFMALMHGDKDMIVELCKEQLVSIFPELELNNAFLLKLIEVGYTGKLLVSVPNTGFYELDLGKLTQLSDARYVQAFVICAAIYKINASKLESAYHDLCAVTDLSKANPMSIAYAMLAISYKNFLKSEVAKSFAADERDLYASYKNKSYKE